MVAIDWAISPDWLPLLSAIAQRNVAAPEVVAAQDWQKRDYDLMAGPTAQRLPGAHRAYAIDGVAVIPITGPIFPRANMMTEVSGATSLTTLQNDFRAALNNPEIGAIMPVIDSPGGVVQGVSSTYDLISVGAKRKPTVAHVAGLGCSAAYWLASAANEITLERTAMVGSIGVVAMLRKQVEPDADGMIAVEVVSSNAPDKRPDPQSEDGVKSILARIDEIEGHFVNDVARGRSTTTAKVKSDFGAGGDLIGARAVAAGMADRVQSQEATLSALRRTVANQRKLASLKQ
ncbi:MAG: S49 family peptidase [Bradyrhizobium sp.]